MTVMMDLYKLLSLGLSYPEEKRLNMMEKILGQSSGFPQGRTGENITALKELFACKKPLLSYLEHEYLALFDTAVKVSPYETEYLTEKISRKPFELADIAGFYSAFGVDVNEDKVNREPVDHIAVELEFMAILASKEAFAEKNCQEENRAVVLEAKTKFLKDHLLRWGFVYCSRLRDSECSAFYKILGNLLESVLDLECERCELDAQFFKNYMYRASSTEMPEEYQACGQLFKE